MQVVSQRVGYEEATREQSTQVIEEGFYGEVEDDRSAQVIVSSCMLSVRDEAFDCEKVVATSLEEENCDPSQDNSPRVVTLIEKQLS